MLHEAYVQRGNGIFRLPALFRWTNLISTKKHISEIASAPEHLISFDAGLAEVRHCLFISGYFTRCSQVLQTDWTVGRDVTETPYHTPAIRVGLRNISQYFPQMHDELVQAFDESLALQNHGMGCSI
jgi:hypothetical protein